MAAFAALVLAGCGSSSSGDASSPAASGGSSAATPVRVAYLSFAVANTYDAPMQAAAQKVADTQGATMTVFDAANDPRHVKLGDMRAGAHFPAHRGLVSDVRTNDPIDAANLGVHVEHGATVHVVSPRIGAFDPTILYS